MLKVECKTCSRQLGKASDSIAASYMVESHIEATGCEAGRIDLTCTNCQEVTSYDPEIGLSPRAAALKITLWEMQHEHKEQA